MSATVSSPEPAEQVSPRRQQIAELIKKNALLLPPQGPVSAFIFLNVLEALEDLPFEEGVRRGARLHGCRPYLSEDQYRQHLMSGRIRFNDLNAVLADDLGDSAEDRIAGLCTRRELRRAMLSHPLRSGPVEELRWLMAETDALTKVRSDAPPDIRGRLLSAMREWMIATSPQPSRPLVDDLVQHFGPSFMNWSDDVWEDFSLKVLWRLARRGAQSVELPWQRAEMPLRHRDLLFEVTGRDSDALLNEVFIRFCAAYADQGQANWALPNRAEGFFRAFLGLHREPIGPPDRWLRGLSGEAERILSTGQSPLESIEESLELLGVPPSEWEDFLAASMLALKGWAALLHQMDVRRDRVPIPAHEGVLIDFLAVRLLLERFALTYVAEQSLPGFGKLANLRAVAQRQTSQHLLGSVEQRSVYLFLLAQVLGWSPPQLIKLSNDQWQELVAEIEAFNALERRRVFHQAFERRYRVQALDAVAARVSLPAPRVARPRFQACFCIDAREESFRRHLEEVAPDTETFAAPGFFIVPMYYRGIADAHFAALCPIVVRPKHWVVEEVVESLEEQHRQRARTRRALGTASHRLHRGSFGATAGAVLTASFGVLASVPLVARVLFPRLTARLRKSATRYVEPPPLTRLRLERKAAEPGPEGDHLGFSLDEMCNTAERVLRDIGLTHHFARLVFFLGHGSFCLNNPHKSAYDCGACTGSAGGPNARALAFMVNDARVREVLAKRGLTIPANTVFLGGLHNTGDDTVKFFDLDLLPESHRADLTEAEKTLAEVCKRNAHERCRRFQSAPLDISFEAAHRHVEGRTEDLAQTRPEFGNATNAMCFVGRRERLRGLYMDRRSFMHSYDPTADDENATILGRILAPVVPVCEGINLTYFFSYIDSPGWGSGTKLPHNVTSLLGVMDGYQSDIRSGLPFQSVEIHEPLRLLFVIEATPATMFKIMERDKWVGRILKNGWSQFAILDPNSAQLQFFQNGRFVPYEPEANLLPSVPSSLDWYRGHREHLPFALIEKGFVPKELTQ